MGDTEESINNLTSALSKYTKQLEKSNAILAKNNVELNSTKKTQEKISKETVNNYKVMKESSSLLEKSAGFVKDIFESTVKLSSTMASIGTAGFLANVVKDTINLNNEMTALSMRMGKGKAGIKELTNTVSGLQASIGTSYETAVSLVSELAKIKYDGSIKEAAAGIDLFSRATGVSNGEVLQLTTNLSKGSGLSGKSINALYAGMVKVQQEVGISDQGMTALVNSISEASYNMTAFGKSSDEVKRMSTDMVALVGSLEKVGISAQKSTQFLNDLTDPDRIQDNILLYSQLGVSIEDAMSGSIDMDTMDSSLKELSRKIVDMGPIAGSQFAKSMGMSFKDASKMVNVQEGAASQLSDQAETSEEKALETLKALEKTTEGLGKQATTFFNKLEGKLRSLGPILFIAVAAILPKLLKHIGNSLHNLFTKSSKEVDASVKDSAEKNASVVTDAVGSSVSAGIKKANDSFKALAGSAGDALKGTFKSFFGDTESKMEKLRKKAKKESFADAFLTASKQNLIDSIKSDIADSNKKIEDYSKRMTDIGLDVSAAFEKGNDGILRINKSALNEFETSKDLTKEKRKYLEYISKQYSVEQAGLDTSSQKLKVQMGARYAYAKQINDLTESISNKEKDQAEAAQAVNKSKSKLADLSSKIAIKKEAMNHVDDETKKVMQQQLNLLQGELAETVQIKKINDSKQKGLSVELETEKNKLKTIEKQVKEKEKLKNPLSKIASGTWDKIKTTARESTIGQAVAASKKKSKENGGGKVRQNARAAGKVAAMGLGGIGKMLGGISKSIGPMAIVMALIGKIMDKIKEPLEELIDEVMGFLEPVLKPIITVLGKLMRTLVKTLMPPILNILSGILSVAHVILKPLISILKAMENIPVVGKAFKGVGDTLEQLTGSEVTGGLKDAAKAISNMPDDFAKKQDEQNDKSQAAVIKAEGGSLVAVSSTTGQPAEQPKATQEVSSTTQQVSEKKEEPDAAAQMAEEKEKKAQKLNRETIEEKVIGIYDAINSISNFLINTGKNNALSYTSSTAKTIDLSAPENSSGTGT